MKDVENLLTTDYIYFPLKKDSKLFINDGEYIYKNDKIIEYNNKIIYSSVSGKVLGMTNIDNNKYLVIEPCHFLRVYTLSKTRAVLWLLPLLLFSNLITG